MWLTVVGWCPARADLVFAWGFYPYYANVVRRWRVWPTPARISGKLEVVVLFCALIFIVVSSANTRLVQNAPDSGVVQIGDVLVDLLWLRRWVLRFAPILVALGPHIVLSLVHAVGGAISCGHPLGAFELFYYAKPERWLGRERSTVL